MKLTECICAEIEDMRQKKRMRFQTASAQTEKVIASLTLRRASLFEALESELQKQELPAVEKQELSSRIASVAASPIEKQATSKAVVANTEDDATSDLDVYEDEAENRKHTILGSTEDITAQPEGNVSTSVDEETRLKQLRADAAETDTQLYEERQHLQALRGALASSLSRLDDLEEDLCKHSSKWETEEKTRLSVDQTPELSRKRKRDVGAEDSYGQSKKVMRRALETLFVLGVGAGMAVVKQAYAK